MKRLLLKLFSLSFLFPIFSSTIKKWVSLFSLLGCVLLCSSQEFPGLDWVTSMGGPASEKAYEVAIDKNGDIIIMGSFEDSVDFDPGPGIHMLGTAERDPAIFIMKMTKNGDLIWAHKFATGLYDNNYRKNWLEVDQNGNIYACGNFGKSMDFNPGAGNYVLRPRGDEDLFLLKLSTHGTYMWAKQLGGVGVTVDEPSITLDPAGNIFMTGQFKNGTLDFDPGAGTFLMTSHQYYAHVFVQKFNTQGSLLWAGKMGNANFTFLNPPYSDNKGNLILSGSFRDSLDVDLGPGVHIIPPEKGKNYLIKLDPGGALIWAKQHAYGISRTVVDAYNNIYTAGSFRGRLDFDPGPDSSFIQSSANGARNSTFIQKLNKDGDFLWAGAISALLFNYPLIDANASMYGIELDERGYIYIKGSMRGPVDVNLRSDTTIIHASNNMNNFFVNNEFIAKYSPFGKFLWLGQMETDQSIPIRDYEVSPEGHIYFAGGLGQPMDLDPGPDSLIIDGSGGSILIGRWSQDGCSAMKVEFTQVKDYACSPAFVRGKATGGIAPYSYVWNTNPLVSDSLSYFSNPGIYELSATDDAGCTRSAHVLLSASENPNNIDLRLNTTSSTFRAGFESDIWVDAFNEGCIPVNGEISVELDPWLTLFSSSVPPDTINGQRLIWFVPNMNADSAHFQTHIRVEVSRQAQRGEQICYKAIISSKGGQDNNTKNNLSNFCSTVIASYDPNDKQVNPQGICEEGFIEPNEKLTYTVRFQNVGNADAIHIFILDTLDQRIDLSSVRVVGQSHKPMITEVLPGRVLKFRFNNIHLPDSMSDEAGSHGYVMFEADPIPELESGMEVSNKAGIYFDFNEPVITNTVRNTIVDILPSLDTTVVQGNGCNSYTLNGKTYTAEGIYYQHLKGQGSCDSILALTVSLQPLDTSVSQIANTLTAKEGGAHGLNVSYQWVDCNNGNAPISGATSQNFTPEVNGSYAVIISRDDCSEISACYEVNSVGIDPDFQSQIRYYPNPSQGWVKVELGEPYQEIQLKLINPLGQMVQEVSYKQLASLALELPPQAGVYFLKIEADGKKAVIKFLRN